MRAGRYWIRLSRFFTIAASRSDRAQAARLPRPFFMFDQAPSAGLGRGVGGIRTSVSPPLNES